MNDSGIVTVTITSNGKKIFVETSCDQSKQTASRVAHLKVLRKVFSP